MLWEQANYSDDLKTEVKMFITEYEKVDVWYQSIPFVEGENELYQKVSKSWKEFKGAIEEKFETKSKKDLMPLHDAFGNSIGALIKFQGNE